MNGYRFKAHTPDGKVFRGVIQATTMEEAHRALARQTLIADSVRPAPLDRSLQLRRSVAPRALVQFSRQFATLIESAVPLLLSLEILQGLADDRALRKALSIVTTQIEAGSTLADALRHHPHVFSDIFVNIVDAGEESGTLDVALTRLADYLERAQAVREKVHGAMIYPMVILLVAVGSVAALLTLVVPTFEGMFAASGVALPYPTLVLVNSSRFLASNWAYFALGVLLTILVSRAIYSADWGRRIAHRILLRIPVAGRLTRKVAVARLSRTLSSLLSSGVPILDAIVAGGRTCGNMVLQDALLRCRENVAVGLGVSDALALEPALPDLLTRMVSVGEQTGRLDSMFAKVATFYEREVDAEVDGLLKALEPMLVVLVGVILGGMVIAMYLPIFDAIGAVDPTVAG